MRAWWFVLREGDVMGVGTEENPLVRREQEERFEINGAGLSS